MSYTERNVRSGPDVDILSAKSGVIVQGCNAKGVMGAGLAKQIACKWPEVKAKYMSYHADNKLRLGSVHFIKVDKNLYVANAITQEDYGLDKSVVYADYYAIKKAMRKINAFAEKKNLSFA